MSDPQGEVVSPLFGGVQPLDYLRVVYRRRWLALAVFLAVVVSVAVYTFTAVPLYQAQASILIETDTPKVVSFEEVLSEESRSGDYYQTQYKLLESRALAQRTTAALELWKQPSFISDTEQGAVGELREGLLIAPVRGSRMVNVQFRGPDPELAALIANEHARQYIEQSLEHRFVVSKEVAGWLDAQLAGERKRVEQSDSALQAYREQNDAVSLEEGQNIVVQKLADLNGAVTKAKTNRIEKEAQYRELLAVQHDRSALDSFPAILSNPFIQQLKGDLARLQREYAQLSETLGERHPTLAEKRSAVETTEGRLNAEVSRVVQSVRTAFQAAQAEEASLTTALEEQKREALALNRRAIRYSALVREAESVRLVYQSLLQRAKETGVSGEVRATNIRIIDPARPPGSPVTPRPVYNLMMAFLTGSLLAVGFAFLVEFLDDHIRTPDDLTRHLRLPFLGLVPKVRSKDGHIDLLMRGGAPSPFQEAMRSMRTAMLAASGPKGPFSIVVASSTEGEGKTVVAVNLAVALAQSKQRVLLVDADMRRPSVHTMFGQELGPGLSDVLMGTAMLARVLQPTNVPGLTMVSAGSPSPEAPELLGSAPFKELFDIMQEHFDWVIIDSPPVLHVTDACVVARLAVGTAFVVGAGMTRARAARLGIEELERAGARIVGTILNRADLEHHPYYYAPYSRGEYRPSAALEAGGSRRVPATSLFS